MLLVMHREVEEERAQIPKMVRGRGVCDQKNFPRMGEGGESVLTIQKFLFYHERARERGGRERKGGTRERRSSLHLSIEEILS